MATAADIAKLLQDARPNRTVRSGDSIDVQTHDPLKLIAAIRAHATLDAGLQKSPHLGIKSVRICDCAKLKRRRG